jgi:hypothetical protein
LDSFPTIEFTPLEIDFVKGELGLPPDEVSVLDEVEEAPKGRRGRKPTSLATTPLPPAPLRKADEREVAKRLQNIMQGGTGILGNIKDYIPMTDEEAEAICVPLSSYLVRNADTIPVARQVLENYDLAAITIGVGAYVVRVYHDRREEVAVNRESSGATFIDRIHPTNSNGESEPEVWAGGFISNANGSRSGTLS